MHIKRIKEPQEIDINQENKKSRLFNKGMDTIEKKMNPTCDQLCCSIAISKPIYINLEDKSQKKWKKKACEHQVGKGSPIMIKP